MHRGDKLVEIVDKSSELEATRLAFHQKSKQLRRRFHVEQALTSVFCCACLAMQYALARFREWRKSRALIDGVFADLENLFYVLSDALFRISASPQHNACVNLAKLLLRVLVVYPLVLALCVVTVFPSLFLLLIVRVNKIETDTKQLNVRQAVLAAESKCKRCCRLLQQFARSSLVFVFLAVYPVLITYVIIPKYRQGGDNALVVRASIGSYLGTILVLQLLGTYRGLKSYSQKLKEATAVRERYSPQRFECNIGSLLAMALLLHEVVQLAMFATHTIRDAYEPVDTATSSEVHRHSDKEYVAFVLKWAYLSFDFVSAHAHPLPMYSLLNALAVGLLLAFCAFRFVFELHRYAALKQRLCDLDAAQEFYFHSFVGTIIYGHGTLKQLSKLSCKVVSLLSDTLFLVVAEKLILTLCCHRRADVDVLVLDMDDRVVCWQGEHQFYATLNLILIGYYIPMSVMIAPMFAESDADDGDADSQEPESKCKRLLSLSSTVSFVKPFVSAMTVSKCFMLISATFVFGGDAVATVVSQTVSMASLLLLTLAWCFRDLRRNGLTQNRPGFPFSANLIRVAGFGCGFVGCAVEMTKRFSLLLDDDGLHWLVLLGATSALGLALLVVFKCYHAKYATARDEMDLAWAVRYEHNALSVVPFCADGDDKE